MRLHYFSHLFIFLFFPIFCMEEHIQQPVIASHLDLLSGDAPTTTIIGLGMQNVGSLVSTKESPSPRSRFACLSKIKNFAGLGSMLCNVNAIRSTAEKIGASTPGRTNVIKKLIAQLSKDYPTLVFNQDAWFNLAVVPVLKPDLVHFFKLFQQNNVVSIGISNQDPQEHIIYQKKMKDDYQIDTKELFAAIIGIPSIESQDTSTNRMKALVAAMHPKLGQQSPARILSLALMQKIYQYVVQEENFDNFVVAPTQYPSIAYIETLKAVARRMQPDGNVFVIDPDVNRVATLQQNTDLGVAAVTSLSNLSGHISPTLTQSPRS